MKELFLNTAFFTLVFSALILVFTQVKGLLRDDEYKGPAVEITQPCNIPFEWDVHYIAVNDSTFVVYSPTDTIICKK